MHSVEGPQGAGRPTALPGQPGEVSQPATTGPSIPTPADGPAYFDWLCAQDAPAMQDLLAHLSVAQRMQMREHLEGEAGAPDPTHGPVAAARQAQLQTLADWIGVLPRRVAKSADCRGKPSPALDARRLWSFRGTQARIAAAYEGYQAARGTERQAARSDLVREVVAAEREALMRACDAAEQGFIDRTEWLNMGMMTMRCELLRLADVARLIHSVAACYEPVPEGQEVDVPRYTGDFAHAVGSSLMRDSVIYFDTLLDPEFGLLDEALPPARRNDEGRAAARPAAEEIRRILQPLVQPYDGIITRVSVWLRADYRERRPDVAPQGSPVSLASERSLMDARIAAADAAIQSLGEGAIRRLSAQYGEGRFTYYPVLDPETGWQRALDCDCDHPMAELAAKLRLYSALAANGGESALQAAVTHLLDPEAHDDYFVACGAGKYWLPDVPGV
jgi:hypothetical protein